MPAPVRGLTVPAHALVTGASSGIGLALACALLERAGVASVAAVSRHASVDAAPLSEIWSARRPS